MSFFAMRLSIIFIGIGNFCRECPQIVKFDLGFQPQDMRAVGRMRHLRLPRIKYESP